MPQEARGLAKRRYRGKRAVGNIHSVYDRMILLCESERNSTPTTTAAAADTDKAESPRNRPVRPGGLPVARATGDDAGGRPSDWRAPRWRPRTRQPCAPRVRPGMTQWSDGTDHVGRAPLPGFRGAAGRRSAPRNRVAVLPVLVYARRFCEVKKRFKKRAKKNDAPPPGRQFERQKQESFGNRQSRQWSLRRLAQLRRLVELVVERLQADAEFRGGLGLVARVAVKRS